MKNLKSVQLHLLGPRNELLKLAKLAEDQIGPLDAMLDEAKKKNPAATEEDLVRAVWVHGLHAVTTALEAGRRLQSTTGRFDPFAEEKKPKSAKDIEVKA